MTFSKSRVAKGVKYWHVRLELFDLGTDCVSCYEMKCIVALYEILLIIVLYLSTPNDYKFRVTYASS